MTLDNINGKFTLDDIKLAIKYKSILITRAGHRYLPYDIDTDINVSCYLLTDNKEIDTTLDDCTIHINNILEILVIDNTSFQIDRLFKKLGYD